MLGSPGHVETRSNVRKPRIKTNHAESILGLRVHGIMGVVLSVFRLFVTYSYIIVFGV